MGVFALPLPRYHRPEEKGLSGETWQAGGDWGEAFTDPVLLSERRRASPPRLAADLLKELRRAF